MALIQCRFGQSSWTIRGLLISISDDKARCSAQASEASRTDLRSSSNLDPFQTGDAPQRVIVRRVEQSPGPTTSCRRGTFAQWQKGLLPVLTTSTCFTSGTGSLFASTFSRVPKAASRRNDAGYRL